MTAPAPDFDHYVTLADRCYETAAWEEASKALDAASLANGQCSTERLIALDTRRGHIEWRKGNYGRAVALLNQALAANGHVRNLTHVEIVGELGNIHIKFDFPRARELLTEALQAAEHLLEHADSLNDLELSMSAKLHISRAVGNLGLVKYHIATTAPVRRQPLLAEAIDHLEKRIQWADELQRQLERHGDRSNFSSRASVLKVFGLGRLALCYTALHQHEQALQYSLAATRLASEASDQLVRGLNRFYHGYVLLAAGQPDRALRQWESNSDTDLCAPVIALCKEPTKEHCGWLRKMRSLGSRFDRHDGFGYTALDYAVLSDHADCIAIVIRGLRDEMDRQYPDEEARADQQVAIKVAEAHRRKQYREILQLTFRPILANPPCFPNSDARLMDLRKKYAHDLKTDLRKRELFDRFKFIPYPAFRAMGALPKPTEQDDMVALQHDIRAAADRIETQLTPYPYVVFFSYEWRGRKVGRLNQPDDDQNTQYNRMIEAIELLFFEDDFTTRETTLHGDDVFIWLDVASIDQNNQDPGAQDRGVSALPLMITLCNTMISLVDDSYFSRAWCAVEALLMQSLLSYGHHSHFEHLSDQLGTGVQHPQGRLVRSQRLEQLQDVATNDLKYGVTKPEDRSSIRFLARQAKLLQKI